MGWFEFKKKEGVMKDACGRKVGAERERAREREREREGKNGV